MGRVARRDYGLFLDICVSLTLSLVIILSYVGNKVLEYGIQHIRVNFHDIVLPSSCS